MTSNYQDMSKPQLIAALEKCDHREALGNAAERSVHIGYYEWNCEEGRLQSCSEECAAIQLYSKFIQMIAPSIRIISERST
jgi:hypothetical protein